MSRYVEVPVSSITHLVDEVAAGVTKSGGSVDRTIQGKEVVYEIHHSKGPIIRFYTSAANGASVLRECDSDAVRVVVGIMHDGKFRPTRKAQKILRTAPTKLPEEERVMAFVERVKEALRGAYRIANKGVKTCPKCGTPMAIRESKMGHRFWGCLAFPECKVTDKIRP